MANPTPPAPAAPVPPQGTQTAPPRPTPVQAPANAPAPAQGPGPGNVYPEHPNPVNPVTGKEEVLANQNPEEHPDDFKPVAAPDHDPITGNPFPVKKYERGDEGEIEKVKLEPTEEVPHVIPPKANKYPLSSAPVDPEAPPAAKTTQSIQ